jgi:hypothetical protein
VSRFIGIATPRSGTAWLSNFLTYGDHSFCRHEALFGCDSLTDYEDSIERITMPAKGSIDTAAPFLAAKMYRKFNETHKFFVVVRQYEEVESSLKTLRLDTSMMEFAYDSISNLIESCPWIPVIGYDRLFESETLIELWKYLEIPSPFPLQRLEMLRGILVEDGLSKGFGRFSTAEGMKSAQVGFRKMFGDRSDFVYASRSVN